MKSQPENTEIKGKKTHKEKPEIQEKTPKAEKPYSDLKNLFIDNGSERQLFIDKKRLDMGLENDQNNDKVEKYTIVSGDNWGKIMKRLNLPENCGITYHDIIRFNYFLKNTVKFSIGTTIYLPKDIESFKKDMIVINEIRDTLKNNKDIFSKEKNQLKYLIEKFYPSSPVSLGFKAIGESFLDMYEDEVDPNYPRHYDKAQEKVTGCANYIRSFFRDVAKYNDMTEKEKQFFIRDQNIDAWMLPERFMEVGFVQKFGVADKEHPNLMNFFDRGRVMSQHVDPISAEKRPEYEKAVREFYQYINNGNEDELRGSLIPYLFENSGFRGREGGMRDYNHNKKRDEQHLNTHQTLYLGKKNQNFKAFQFFDVNGPYNSFEDQKQFFDQKMSLATESLEDSSKQIDTSFESLQKYVDILKIPQYRKEYEKINSFPFLKNKSDEEKEKFKNIVFKYITPNLKNTNLKGFYSDLKENGFIKNEVAFELPEMQNSLKVILNAGNNRNEIEDGVKKLKQDLAANQKQHQKIDISKYPKVFRDDKNGFARVINIYNYAIGSKEKSKSRIEIITQGTIPVFEKLTEEEKKKKAWQDSLNEMAKRIDQGKESVYISKQNIISKVIDIKDSNLGIVSYCDDLVAYLNDIGDENIVNFDAFLKIFGLDKNIKPLVDDYNKRLNDYQKQQEFLGTSRQNLNGAMIEIKDSYEKKGNENMVSYCEDLISILQSTPSNDVIDTSKFSKLFEINKKLEKSFNDYNKSLINHKNEKQQINTLKQSINNKILGIKDTYNQTAAYCEDLESYLNELQENASISMDKFAKIIAIDKNIKLSIEEYNKKSFQQQKNEMDLQYKKNSDIFKKPINVIDFIINYIQKRADYPGSLNKGFRDDCIKGLTSWPDMIEMTVGGKKIDIKEQLNYYKLGKTDNLVKIYANDDVSFYGPVVTDAEKQPYHRDPERRGSVHYPADGKNEATLNARGRFVFEFLICKKYHPTEFIQITEKSTFYKKSFNKYVGQLDVKRQYSLFNEGELIEDVLNKIIPIAENFKKRGLKNPKSPEYQSALNHYREIQIRGLQLSGYLQDEKTLNPGAFKINEPIPYFAEKNEKGKKLKTVYEEYVKDRREETRNKTNSLISIKDAIDFSTKSGDNYTKIFNAIAEIMCSVESNYSGFSEVKKFNDFQKRLFVKRILEIGHTGTQKLPDNFMYNIVPDQNFLLKFNDIKDIFEEIKSISYTPDIKIFGIDNFLVDNLVTMPQNNHLIKIINEIESNGSGDLLLWAESKVMFWSNENKVTGTGFRTWAKTSGKGKEIMDKIKKQKSIGAYQIRLDFPDEKAENSNGTEEIKETGFFTATHLREAIAKFNEIKKSFSNSEELGNIKKKYNLSNELVIKIKSRLESDSIIVEQIGEIIKNKTFEELDSGNRALLRAYLEKIMILDGGDKKGTAVAGRIFSIILLNHKLNDIITNMTARFDRMGEDIGAVLEDNEKMERVEKGVLIVNNISEKDAVYSFFENFLIRILKKGCKMDELKTQSMYWQDVYKDAPKRQKMYHEHIKGDSVFSMGFLLNHMQSFISQMDEQNIKDKGNNNIVYTKLLESKNKIESLYNINNYLGISDPFNSKNNPLYKAPKESNEESDEDETETDSKKKPLTEGEKRILQIITDYKNEKNSDQLKTSIFEIIGEEDDKLFQDIEKLLGSDKSKKTDEEKLKSVKNIIKARNTGKTLASIYGFMSDKGIRNYLSELKVDDFIYPHANDLGTEFQNSMFSYMKKANKLGSKTKDKSDTTSAHASK